MEWPDREIKHLFVYVTDGSGLITSGCLVTLKAPLTQRGFFCQKHRRGIALSAVPSTHSSRLSTRYCLCYVRKTAVHVSTIELCLQGKNYQVLEWGYGYITHGYEN